MVKGRNKNSPPLCLSRGDYSNIKAALGWGGGVGGLEACSSLFPAAVHVSPSMTYRGDDFKLIRAFWIRASTDDLME